MDGNTMIAMIRALTAALPALSPEDRRLVIAWEAENLPSQAELQAELARRCIPEQQPKVRH